MQILTDTPNFCLNGLLSMLTTDKAQRIPQWCLCCHSFKFNNWRLSNNTAKL